jgi:uncharacterized protein YjiK
MSIKRLSTHIDMMSDKTSIKASDIAQLREAAGSKVSSAERAMVDSFVREHSSALTKGATTTLASEFAIELPPTIRLQAAAIEPLDVAEASGVVRLNNGAFLVVDDAQGIFMRDQAGKTHLMLSSKDHKALAGLEGICLSADQRAIYVVSEDRSLVSTIPLAINGEHVKLGKPKPLGKLPALGDVKNSGWEGIDVLPGRFSPDGQDKLVAVNEAYPRRIGIFSLPDLQTTAILKLPAPFNQQLTDLSDIAVDPRTGHLLIMSDESSCVVETKISVTHKSAPGALLENIELQPIRKYDLSPSHKSKYEGLCLNQDGAMWAVSDGERKLFRFDL